MPTIDMHVYYTHDLTFWRIRKSDVGFCGARVYAGVKQVPIHELLQGKTYMFFSHTIKGQEDNMALLQACLDKKVLL